MKNEVICMPVVGQYYVHVNKKTGKIAWQRGTRQILGTLNHSRTLFIIYGMFDNTGKSISKVRTISYNSWIRACKGTGHRFKLEMRRVMPTVSLSGLASL